MNLINSIWEPNFWWFKNPIELSPRLLPQRNKIEELDLTANFIADFPEDLINQLTRLRKLHVNQGWGQ